MPKSSRRLSLPALPQNFRKDPRVLARFILGLLLLANLIAAFAIFRPLGGSAEEWTSNFASYKDSSRASNFS